MMIILYFNRLSFLLSLSLLFLISCSEKEKTDQIVFNPNGRHDAWGFAGPGGGGAMFSPTVSPHDPDFVFVSCDMTGSYVTHDGGTSWRMFNLRGVNRFYVFDPLDPDIIYARSIALFRSRDAGDGWEVIYPDPKDITGIISKGDHAQEVIVTKDSLERTVYALAIDPDVPGKLYAGINLGGNIGLYISSDWGDSWEKRLELSEPVKDIFVDPASASDSRRLILTGNTLVICLEGDKAKSHPLPAEVESYTQYASGYSSKQNKLLLYAITGKSYFDPDGGKSGIYLSKDYGTTWENVQGSLISKCMTGAELPEWRAIACCSTNPEVVYISYANFQVDKDTVYIGVAKTEDEGVSWDLVWKDKANGPDPKPDANFQGAWLNERFGPGWGENPFAIGVAPGNPDICYGTDFGRTVKTRDGGRNWGQVYTRKKPDGGWISTGLQVTTNYMLAFDPFNAGHILMANTDTGMLESWDGGESWTSATHNNGVPRPWYNSTYWIAFDPDVQNRVWTVMSRNHDLPRPKMWRNGGVNRYMGGVLYSEDGARHWTPVSEDIGEAAMTHILLDPDSPADARILYACAFGKGVYKSIDGGKSWLKKNQGIEGPEPFAWRITHRDSDGTLFLVASRRSSDGSIGNVEDGALYRSTNGADSWERMNLPEGTNGPTSILADPEMHGRLLLSAWGRLMKGPYTPDSGGGIFISEDDGNTWSQVLEHDQHIHDITMDLRNGVFYACGFNASAYRSEDRGHTWGRIKGYNFKWGKRVEPDPADQGKIYIITFGGGVWHGPALGDPEAMEDIVTSIAAYTKN